MINDFKPGWSTDRYTGIVKHRQQHPPTGKYETHHIIPESFFKERSRPGPAGWLDGDPEAPENKVQLTPREHFMCHWLLRRMTNHKPKSAAYHKMMDALMGMRPSNQHQQRYRTPLVARVYEALKTEYAEIQRERMLGDRNPMYGKTHTDEIKQRISLANTGEKNGAKQPKARKKISASKIGKKRGAFSDEWLEKMSKNHKSKQPDFDGSHSEETKKLLSELASKRRYSQVTNDKRREASGGRKEITNGVIYKKVKTDELQRWLDDGWIIKGRPRKKRQTT